MVVKKKNPNYQLLIILLLTVILAASCSKITRVKDVFTQPTAREKYERDLEQDPVVISLWKETFENALFDSVAIALPYAEAGQFSQVSPEVYSYNFALNPGERLKVEIDTDTLNTLVFLDLYRQEIDSVTSYEHLLAADFAAKDLQQEIEEPGVYKLLMQPEISAASAFKINIYKEAVYAFPVAGKGNSAVQSFWGATRDGGRRSHEGIDIFAAKGTPVVAATEGRVSRTGDRGLGGKQVWLRDGKRGNSLYYAHLDSIIAVPGQRVKIGDTLGLVGNTGNARTTPPHLHFGIYKGYRGAINPLPYVYESPTHKGIDSNTNSQFLLATATANLRKGPSTKAEIATRIQPQDTLRFLGETIEWYHTRLGNENFFIHKSLARPL